MKLKVNAQLGEARNKLAKAEAELRAFIREEWPKGSRMTWLTRENKTTTGVVLNHDGGGRVKVRRDDTGKEYWIETRRIIC